MANFAGTVSREALGRSDSSSDVEQIGKGAVGVRARYAANRTGPPGLGAHVECGWAAPKCSREAERCAGCKVVS